LRVDKFWSLSRNSRSGILRARHGNRDDRSRQLNLWRNQRCWPETMNDVTRNILIWVVIALVMLAVFHRYMPTAPSSALSKDLKFNRVPRAPQTCLTTTAGLVICPPPNGSIGADATGQAVCGRGECSKDERGQWMCSTESGGYVAHNGAGQIVCTGGCEMASAALCESAR
jgi:hypothetical protein